MEILTKITYSNSSWWNHVTTSYPKYFILNRHKPQSFQRPYILLIILVNKGSSQRLAQEKVVHFLHEATSVILQTKWQVAGIKWFHQDIPNSSIYRKSCSLCWGNRTIAIYIIMKYNSSHLQILCVICKKQIPCFITKQNAKYVNLLCLPRVPKLTYISRLSPQ